MGVVVGACGMVNAAMACQALITGWSPDYVGLIGCAGATSEEVLPGDVVVGAKIANYSAFQTLRDGSVNIDFPAIRYRTSYLLDRERGGFLFPHSSPRLSLSGTPELIEITEKAAGRCLETLQPWPEIRRYGTDRRPRLHVGTLGSADQINSSLEALSVIRQRYGIDAEDCESAAVAQVCATYEKPFIVIRGISDNESLAPSYFAVSTEGNNLEWAEEEAASNAWSVFLQALHLLGNRLAMTDSQ